jgi:4-carboxymuconolactone decarboxylase
MSKLPGRYQQFRDEFQRISRAYDEVSRLTGEAGPLDDKTVQLIKLGMAIALGHEGAAHSHARRALETGASRAELRQVGLAALTTAGFPRMMAGLSWIDDVAGGALGGRRKARPRRKS